MPGWLSVWSGGFPSQRRQTILFLKRAQVGRHFHYILLLVGDLLVSGMVVSFCWRRANGFSVLKVRTRGGVCLMWSVVTACCTFRFSKTLPFFRSSDSTVGSQSSYQAVTFRGSDWRLNPGIYLGCILKVAIKKLIFVETRESCPSTIFSGSPVHPNILH